MFFPAIVAKRPAYEKKQDSNGTRSKVKGTSTRSYIRTQRRKAVTAAAAAHGAQGAYQREAGGGAKEEEAQQERATTAPANTCPR